MVVAILFRRLGDRLRSASRAETREALLDLAERYQSTQPSYAEDLRAAALPH